MLFETIKGNRDILSDVESSISKSEIEGVHLFTGPPSIGKLMIARKIAKYVTCVGVQDDTCRCQSCRLFPGTPDYHEIVKRSETITVDDIDSFNSFLELVPFTSRMRVAVIDNADKIHRVAAASLLKTLEDLPSNCLVILVTSNPSRLSAPLVSRCYRTEFSPLDPQDVVEILKGMGHKVVGLGNISRCIPYFTGNILVEYGRYQHYMSWVPSFFEKMASGNHEEIMGILRDVDSKDEMSFLMESSIILIGDILKARYGADGMIMSSDDRARIVDLSEIWKEDLCVLTLQKLRDVQERMKMNINLKLGQYLTPVFMWACYFLKQSVERKK